MFVAAAPTIYDAKGPCLKAWPRHHSDSKQIIARANVFLAQVATLKLKPCLALRSHAATYIRRGNKAGWSTSASLGNS